MSARPNEDMELLINGTRRVVSSAESSMLLWVLRDELGLTGTKFGCGAGLCGACTVLIDGVATRTCVTPLSTVTGKTIKTIEGLAEGDKLHPLQQAFIDAQVPQCGWCMSGQIMTAAAFLDGATAPSTDDIDAALNKNICRCGCYHRIREAVAAAATVMAQTGTEEARS
jgi:isoquinoline 1-oxidoreductase subunit alpha